MTLDPGARLGPYQILGPLGAGGMGDVYRARDTRLGREVAIKTLPPGTASDPDRRARFELEARSASALSHPNIITILDVGEAGGTSFIAMECVDGRTLRELLSSGPLPTRKGLDIAAQIAEGLAKAHSAGIVHRDLKPENVMVSKDGFVKILDFGLAKLAPGGPETFSELPTMARPATAAGTVFGTVGYMSPEQASGRPADFRSDQFSVGAMLYEMVTGRRAFHRKTSAETLTAIIREDPEEVGALNPRAPAPLRWIIERCLAKDPEDRYAATRDLARDLASVRDHLSETVSGEARTAGRARPRWLPPALLTLAGLAAGFGLGALLSRRGPAPRDFRFTRLTFQRGTVFSARFAPGGQTVIYGAAWEGNPVEIYTSRLDSPESRPLGLPSADVLSISPSGEMAISLDRRFVFGWESTGTLARVSLGGGAPRPVLENVQEALWTPDGTGLAIVRDVGERRRLEFPVGNAVYESAGWISHARFSPDARRIAFVDHDQRGDNVGSVAVLDLATRRKATVSPPESVNGLGWSPRGDEVWLSNGVAVDMAGNGRRILNVPGGTALHDVSSDGKVLIAMNNWRREIVGLPPGETRERNLSWFDWSFPADLSDDGKTLLFDEQNLTVGGNYAVYLRQTDGTAAVRLGSGRSLGLSPDEKWALTIVQAGGGANDLVLLPTGAGDPMTFPRSSLTYQSGTWFPDGRRVLMLGHEPGRGSRLFVLDVPAGRPKPLSDEGVTLYYWRAVSPDGRQAAAIGANGKMALYPTDGGEPRPVPGTTPDDVPIRWTPDGRSLYVQGGSRVPARVDLLDVRTGARLPWRELTPPDPAGIMNIGPVCVSRDGRSYLYSYRRILDQLNVVEGLR